MSLRRGLRWAAQRALDLLLRLARVAEAADRTGSLMEIHLLHGRCHELLGNDTAARQAWLVGMALPKAERQAVLPVMEDVETRKALSRLLSGTGAPEWALSVLREVDRAPADGGHAEVAQLLVPLCDRERDVLRQLAGEPSGPEIAARLFVSLNTLRTHTKNIYAKLDVNNGRAAVRRAGELEIT